jgi:MFS family permease
MFLSAAGLLLAHSELVLAGVGLLVGATVAPTLINGNTLIEGMVPRQRLTEGLSWMGTGLGIGVAVGSSVAGPLIDLRGYTAGFGAVVTFATTAALIAVFSLSSLRRIVSKQVDREDPVGEPEAAVE